MEKRFKGFQIDKKQALKKLVNKQKSNPANLFNEVIDNLLDEYVLNSTPMEKRELFIYERSYLQLDLQVKCTGLREEDFEAITTIGKTTKSGNVFYGERGIGILSVLNRDYVSKLLLTFWYIPEKRFLDLSFFWENEDELYYKVTESPEQNPDFTTRYSIQLAGRYHFQRAMNIINKRLKYQPSPSFLDGQKIKNAFNTNDVEMKDTIHHIIIRESWSESFEILKNYKYIMSFYSIPGLIYGGHNQDESLSEYIEGYFHKNTPFFYSKAMYFPFVKDINVILNSANLKLTLSKEGFYLNAQYYDLLMFLRKAIFKYLLQNFEKTGMDIKMSNIYIFRAQLGKLIETGKEDATGEDKTDYETKFLQKLSEMEIWRVYNQKRSYTLREVRFMLKDENVPVFYSLHGNNLNFASGKFTHKGILAVPADARYPDEFYHMVYSAVFGDVVNLDLLYDNPKKLDELVERGIVDREDLYPSVRFHKVRNLMRNEKDFISILEEFFNRPEIIGIIENNLFMEIKNIKIGLFDVHNGDKAVLNASFFDPQGNFLLDDRYTTNFQKVDEGGAIFKKPNSLSREQELFIGLNRSSSDLLFLIDNYNKQAVEYSLIFVVNQLVTTQKYVASDSSFYYRLRNNLLQDMWDYIIMQD